LIAVEIVRKNPDQVGFAVNRRRSVVERFFAWIGRNRRLTMDFEATIDSARAFLYAASVMLLVRLIGPKGLTRKFYPAAVGDTANAGSDAEAIELRRPTSAFENG